MNKCLFCFSRTTSPGSSLDSEAKDARFIKREVKEESFLNRDNKVDKNRLRRKQKRRKKNTKVSSNEDSDDSSGDPFVEKRRSNNHRRDISTDRFDVKTSSSRDTSKDRSKMSKMFKDRSRKRVRVKRKGVPKKDNRAKDKYDTDDSTSDMEAKERLFGSSRETSKERSRDRTRVNYKEQETSDESDLFTDTSDDSHFESKLKAKTSPKKPVKKAGVIKNVEAIVALEIATEQTLKVIIFWLLYSTFFKFSYNSFIAF